MMDPISAQQDILKSLYWCQYYPKEFPASVPGARAWQSKLPNLLVPDMLLQAAWVDSQMEKLANPYFDLSAYDSAEHILVQRGLITLTAAPWQEATLGMMPYDRDGSDKCMLYPLASGRVCIVWLLQEIPGAIDPARPEITCDAQIVEPSEVFGQDLSYGRVISPSVGRFNWFRFDWNAKCECCSLTEIGLTEAEHALRGPAPLDKQEEGVRGAETPFPAVDNQEVEILRCLYRRSPTLTAIVDIEDGASLSNKTVGRLVKQLMIKGYVDRPHGPRKGATLTSAGRELVATRYPPTAKK